MQFAAKKLYYRIGEVCRIVGVEAYVLRYWETEFPSLAPRKSKAGQRVYRPKDIELLLTIRRLLYEERFTIAGARKQLARAMRAEPARDLTSGKVAVDKKSQRTPEAPARRLDQVRQELENILTLLERR
jgi:DNA-binding transcriptional MerR regulator